MAEQKTRMAEVFPALAGTYQGVHVEIPKETVPVEVQELASERAKRSPVEASWH